MNFDELWYRFADQGLTSLTPDEIEFMLYFQRGRIGTLEREANTAVRLHGVTAGEINISDVSVTNRPR